MKGDFLGAAKMGVLIVATAGVGIPLVSTMVASVLSPVITTTVAEREISIGGGPRTVAILVSCRLFGV